MSITTIISNSFASFDDHWYEVVNQPVTWAEALHQSEMKTYRGLGGYLVTSTSLSENQFLTNLVRSSVTTGWDNYSIWIAASDREVEGKWRWMAGPETGAEFWEGAANGYSISGKFNAWITSYLQNESNASGMSGTWTNPTSSGSDFAF